tara:strand:+ start:39 stop:494 length:456 start_codon:yes stop_codon:yes gene_type:complete
MADKKISELEATTTLTGTEKVPMVQSGTTKQATISDITSRIVTVAKTMSNSNTVNLSDIEFQDATMIKLSWSGANGTATLNLPDATAANSLNRFFRIITDGTVSSTKRIDLTPTGGQTLDGSTSAYEINASYEGIAVWADGTEWYIIQKKA